MRKLALALLAVALAAPVGARPAVTAISVKAVGGWEMICHVTTSFGDQTVQILDAGHSSLALTGFNNVSCEQTGAGRGPMVVSVAGPATCPFKGATQGACEKSFASGRAGSFAVRPRRP